MTNELRINPISVSKDEIDSLVNQMMESGDPSIDSELFHSSGKKAGRYRNGCRRWARMEISLNKVRKAYAKIGVTDIRCGTCSHSHYHGQDTVTMSRHANDFNGRIFNIKGTFECSKQYGLDSGESAYVKDGDVCLCFEASNALMSNANGERPNFVWDVTYSANEIEINEYFARLNKARKEKADREEMKRRKVREKKIAERDKNIILNIVKTEKCEL
jgi:hypothetical protein